MKKVLTLLSCQLGTLGSVKPIDPIAEYLTDRHTRVWEMAKKIYGG